MKKKREVHEGIINLVHQKSSVDPRPEVIVEKLILFVLSNLEIFRQPGEYAVLTSLRNRTPLNA